MEFSNFFSPSPSPSFFLSSGSTTAPAKSPESPGEKEREGERGPPPKKLLSLAAPPLPLPPPPLRPAPTIAGGDGAEEAAGNIPEAPWKKEGRRDPPSSFQRRSLSLSPPTRHAGDRKEESPGGQMRPSISIFRLTANVL